MPTNAANFAFISARPSAATGCRHGWSDAAPSAARGVCGIAQPVQPGALLPILRSLFRPSGAAGCSHGWSDAALSVAEPVEEDEPYSSCFFVFRPGGAEESPASPRVPMNQELLRPCRGGVSSRVPFHGLRRRSAAFTRGYIPRPHRGRRRAAASEIVGMGSGSAAAREVAPHAPDAWIDPEATKVGYEVSFTRYFYKPPALRTLEQIRADILALEAETEGLLGEIIGTTAGGSAGAAASGGRK